jgi:hypothetical protein
MTSHPVIQGILGKWFRMRGRGRGGVGLYFIHTKSGLLRVLSLPNEFIFLMYHFTFFLVLSPSLFSSKHWFLLQYIPYFCLTFHPLISAVPFAQFLSQPLRPASSDTTQ